jgi:hypothetical protein
MIDEAELLADRLRYFADPQAPAAVLHPGAKGEHCRNIRLALMRLGCDEAFRFAPPSDSFDEAVSAGLRQLQSSRGHSSVDGLCGPGTRRLLVAALAEQARAEGGNVDPFARMSDPEHRASGSVFISYARVDRAWCEALAALVSAWGYAAWFDVSLSGGERFSQTLMARIDDAYLVLVVETPQAIASEWVTKEVEHAYASGVRILAVEAEPVPAAHSLSDILMNHHRLGAAPADLASPAAKPYREQLKQAVSAAHQVGLQARLQRQARLIPTF